MSEGKGREYYTKRRGGLDLWLNPKAESKLAFDSITLRLLSFVEVHTY